MPEYKSEEGDLCKAEKALLSLRNRAIEEQDAGRKIEMIAMYLQKKKEFHTRRLLNLTTNRETDILNKVAANIIDDFMDILTKSQSE